MEMLRPDGVSPDNPYVPESVLAALVPGQRVRYVLRGECEQRCEIGSFGDNYSALFHEAITNAEGQTGVLKDINYPGIPSHTYFVVTDEPYDFAGLQWTSIVVAASELVLIEDE